MVPIGLLLLFVTGVCPLIAWRRASFSNLRKNLIFPVATAAVAFVVLFALGVRGFYPLLSFTLSAFVLATVSLEFGRGAWVRHQMQQENVAKALVGLTWRNKRRYGGYIVHVGVVLLLVGVTGSSAFKVKADQVLTKGQSMQVGGYQLTYDSFNSYDTNEKSVGQVTFTLKKNGQFLGTVTPVKEYYFNKDQPWTRVDRDTTLARDVYVSLLEYSTDTGEAKVEAFVNPLISWMWIGGFVMAIGGIVALWPDGRDQRRLAARYERQARLHEV
jgi:cytochrome c-type biogenesis protein CcmF